VATALVVTFRLPLFGGPRLHGCCVSRTGQSADVGLGKATAHEVAMEWLSRAIQHFGVVFDVFSPRGRRAEWGKHRAFVLFAESSVVVRRLFRNTSAVKYSRFYVSQARVFVVLGVCPGTCVVPSRSMSSVLDTLTPMFELYIRLRERRQRAVTCVCGCAVTCSALVVEGVVLVGLHSSLACACGATVGPFVHDCETERFCHGGVPCAATVMFVVSMVVPCGGVEVELCSMEVVLSDLPLAIMYPGKGSFLLYCDFGPRQWVACETWSLGSGLSVRLEIKVACWLVSTLLWLVLVERQLDLSSVTARLRVVALPVEVCPGVGTVVVVVSERRLTGCGLLREVFSLLAYVLRFCHGGVPCAGTVVFVVSVVVPRGGVEVELCSVEVVFFWLAVLLPLRLRFQYWYLVIVVRLPCMGSLPVRLVAEAKGCL
ncbi:hypothetical protein Taro_055820, partial [Colocasia esculenta]|nr:hypothetical protein [Colocasia esculenta]